MSARDEACWTNHAREQLEHPANTPSGFELKMDGGRLVGIEGDWLAGAVASEPWTSALDFGCGTGLFVNYFRGDGKRYTGVDRNAAMIDGARRRWGGDPFPAFLLCDCLSGDRLPLADGEVDFVLSVAVLQHHYPADREISVAEIRRVLRKGGRYVFYEETYGSFNPTPAHHERHEDDWGYNQEGWRRFLSPFGFECVLQRDTGHIFRAV